MQYFIKIIISAIIIAVVSEISKRSTFIGALIISLPLTSIITIAWLYFDSRDTQKVIDLSSNIFLMVIPSLAFFLLLSFLLKHGVSFLFSMIASCITMALIYWVYSFLLNKFGYSL